MKRFGVIFALFAVFLLGASNPDLPELTGRVVDRAGILSVEDKGKIEQALLQLEKSTDGGQMAILTIKTLNRMPIEWYGIKLAEKWKIGQKGKDNGAILIISLEDRAMRLEVGYGWEGTVNDARAGDIIRELVPHFQAGNYGAGIVQAVQRVQEFVTGKPVEGLAPLPRQKAEAAEDFELIVSVFFIILILLLMFRKGSGGGYYGGFHHFGGGSGGFGGGGFRGGGGSFGGGGASGRW